MVKGRNEKNWSDRKWRYLLPGIWIFLAMLHAKAALADSCASYRTSYSQTPWAPWLEAAFAVIIGLMVVLAILAIQFLHNQKEQERVLQEEAEKEEP